MFINAQQLLLFTLWMPLHNKITFIQIHPAVQKMCAKKQTVFIFFIYIIKIEIVGLVTSLQENRKMLEDRLITQMVIPVSKESYFNTKWKSNRQQLCAYDMLYHPPDYNPKSARSDRQEPKIIRRNIWDQELHKGIASTTHFQLSRPKWKPYDLPTKEFVRVQVKNENPNMRIENVLEWAVLLNEGKPSLCE